MPTPDALARADQILAKMGVLWSDDEDDLRNNIAEAIDEARLLSELECGRERVQEWADAERLIAWIDDRDRKPANIAFSEGNERQVAYRFEEAWSDVYEVVGEMAWGAGGPLPTLTDASGNVLTREAAQAVFEALRGRMRATRGGWLKRERARVAELEAEVERLQSLVLSRGPG